MIKGSIVAIVTPMQEDGSLDLAAFRALIDFHIEQGTDGIVVVGTTGESPTVNVEEHELLIAEAVKHAAKRIPIIAGTGANSTSEAIELAAFSKKAGADASLTVVPYYNKPTQEGLYLHFKAIAEAVDMPHILYNVPGRTVADMNNDTVLRLAQIPNIVGIKDATGNIERGSDLLQRAPQGFCDLQRRRCQHAGADAARRARHDFGDRERRAQADARDVRGRAERRGRQGARDQFPPARPAPQPVRRSQPDPGEMGGGAHGHDEKHIAPAADPLVASRACEGRVGDAPGWRAQLKMLYSRRETMKVLQIGISGVVLVSLAGCSLFGNSKPYRLRCRGEKHAPAEDAAGSDHARQR